MMAIRKNTPRPVAQGALHRQVREDVDPVAGRRQARKVIPSFETAARACYDAMKEGWKNQLHASRISSLENHIFPLIGTKPVHDVDSARGGGAVATLWPHAVALPSKRWKERDGNTRACPLRRRRKADQRHDHDQAAPRCRDQRRNRPRVPLGLRRLVIGENPFPKEVGAAYRRTDFFVNPAKANYVLDHPDGLIFDSRCGQGAAAKEPKCI